MQIQTTPRNSTPSDALYIDYKQKDPNTKRITMICLPGGPGGDHSIYTNQWEHFFPFVDIVLFDPRGCGQSTIANKACYHMDVYIDDVEDIRQQLELDKIIILGTSYGSMAAQGYAIKYGKQGHLIGLICVNGAPSHEFVDTAQYILNKIGSDAQIKMYQRLLNGDITTDDELREYFALMGPLYSTTAAKSGEIHSARKDVRYNAQAAHAGFAPGGFLRTFDWREQLHTINCPTFIIVGDRDWINHPIHTDQMAERIPNNAYLIVKDSGHIIWADQAEKYYSAVTHFIQSLTKN